MTLLIKNVFLIDGTGRAPANANVLVKNEKIAAIGYFPNFKADEVIDGMGAYLSPGFIDINSGADLYLSLFSNPEQAGHLEQGITTIIGGQNGISLAPIFYGSPELNKFWANIERLNVNWSAVGEFLDNLDALANSKYKKFGVNFGTLAGHATIKEAICGDTARDLTQKEIDVFELVLERSLQEGAFGLSIDLTFPLTAFTSERELKPLFKIVERKKGLVSVKIRAASDNIIFPKEAKEKIPGAVEEIINFAKETGARFQLNNFSCLKGLEKEYKEVLELISGYSAAADIGFNLHPMEYTTAPLFFFLPSWARRGSFEEILSNINSKDVSAKIKKDLPAFKAEEILIYNAPEHGRLNGKTLKDFCDNRDLSAKDGLLELMKMTKLRCEAAYKNLSVKTLAEAIINNNSMISSSFSGLNFDGGAVKSLKKAFPEFLNFVFKKKNIPIEAAVKKMTGIPARQLGLKDRGLIRDGYWADLTIFRDSGIETVIVNGKISLKDGKPTKNVNGKILRHVL